MTTPLRKNRIFPKGCGHARLRYKSSMLSFHHTVITPCRCLHKGEPPLEIGDVYWKLKESVGRYELLLLRAIKFNLMVKLPHPVSSKIFSAECEYFVLFSVLVTLFAGTVKVGGRRGVGEESCDPSGVGVASGQFPHHPQFAQASTHHGHCNAVSGRPVLQPQHSWRRQSEMAMVGGVW